jgi:hypothetical protein
MIIDDESAPLKGSGSPDSFPVTEIDAPPAYSQQYGTEPVVRRRRNRRRFKRRLRLVTSGIFVASFTFLLLWTYTDVS